MRPTSIDEHSPSPWREASSSSALFHHFNDDEAATWCFHFFLSHTRTIACCTFLPPYLHLHCPSISSVLFLGFFSHWYSSVVLLLAAVRFPFSTHARTNLVFALLFCQPVSFLDIEYHAPSHFSSYHVLLLSTIFLTVSFLQWGKHNYPQSEGSYQTQPATENWQNTADISDW